MRVDCPPAVLRGIDDPCGTAGTRSRWSQCPSSVPVTSWPVRECSLCHDQRMVRRVPDRLRGALWWIGASAIGVLVVMMFDELGFLFLCVALMVAPLALMACGSRRQPRAALRRAAQRVLDHENQAY
jgi:hypothetical protein